MMSCREKTGKTLAMRVLEDQNVPYERIEFPESVHDALGVAEHAGVPAEHVYKTLVVEADDPDFKPMLFLVAAGRTLNLKMAARAVGAKKVHMARQVDAEHLTGLKVGGISALALLNRGFPVYLDAPATRLDFIVVSAGRRGLNLRLGVDDFIRVTGARVVTVTD